MCQEITIERIDLAEMVLLQPLALYNASAVEKAALYNMEFMQSHCHLIKACLRTYELENEHHVLGLSEEVELAEQNWRYIERSKLTSIVCLSN